MMCGTCRCFLGASLSQSHRQAKAATQPMPLFKRGFLHFICFAMFCRGPRCFALLRFAQATSRTGTASDRSCSVASSLRLCFCTQRAMFCDLKAGSPVGTLTAAQSLREPTCRLCSGVLACGSARQLHILHDLLITDDKKLCSFGRSSCSVKCIIRGQRWLLRGSIIIAGLEHAVVIFTTVDDYYSCELFICHGFHY